ncbi:type IV secretion system protein, partial [Paracoccus denitrificans]
GKTAFMAERVLGNVVSSGIKVLVLAVIIGIGSTLFSQFTTGFGGVAPTVDDAMAIVLAALSLLGLGIFGPGIANGLVSGGPQLGAGAAVGTGLAVGGAALVAGGATVLGAKGGAMAARGGAATAGAASAAYTLHSAGESGLGGALSGVAGIGKGAGIAALSPLRKAAASISKSHAAGVKTAFTGTGGSTTQGTLGGVGASVPTPSSPGSPPAWAQRLRGQAVGRGATVAAHAVRSGDSHGPGASVSLSESDKP